MGILICLAYVCLGAGADSVELSKQTSLFTDTLRIEQKVDEYVEAVRKRAHVPGLSVSILRDGKLILAKGYGMANLELGVPATEKTLYQCGSITKQFTATGIMMLVEEGRIQLGDKIHEYISGLPTEWSDVTVQHLLTHTSGITCYTHDPELMKNLTLDVTKDKLFEIVNSYPNLQFTPGEKWDYCNSGYVLLGRIVEEVSGQDYADFLKKRIFDPLQMRNTQINNNKAILSGRAAGYIWESDTLQNAKVMYTTWPFAAGNLISNVVDLAKWNQALYGDEILPQELLQQMWTPVQLNDGSTFPYGFAWDVDSLNDHLRIGHAGAIFGFGAALFRYPDEKLSIVVLMNEDTFIDPLPIHTAYLTGLTLSGICEPKLATPVRRAVQDQFSDITTLAKNFLSKFMRGQPDKSLCSKEFWERFSAHDLPYYVHFFKQAGPSISITLIDREKEGKDVTDLYQLEFPSSVYVLRLVINGSSKIADMILEGEILATALFKVIIALLAQQR